MSALKISRREVRGVVVLDLNGPIALGQGNIDLHRELRSLIEQDQKRVLLNLAKVSYIDSSGLGELVAGFASIEKNGGEMKMVNLTDRVSELMMITKLLTVFDVFDDEQSAIESFPTSAGDLDTGPLESGGTRANSIA